jgi:hypothetical protein
MEPLHLLFKKAHQQGLLQSLSSDCDTFRVSLYVDDAAMFINSSQQELQVTNHILQIFADASGLKTNLAKTQCYPIQCQEINLDFIALSGHEASSFPCIYLGLPLHIRKPSKMDMQPLPILSSIPTQRWGICFLDGKRSLCLTLAENCWSKLFYLQSQLISSLSSSWVNGFSKELIVLEEAFCGRVLTQTESKEDNVWSTGKHAQCLGNGEVLASKIWRNSVEL